MNPFIFTFFLFEDFCLKDFTRSREEKPIWSERPRYNQISPEGISMSTESVKNWPVPQKVKDIQAFLRFANFYRRFIEGFSKICKPLTDLTQKDKMFEWTSQCEHAFQHLKSMFTEGPILAHFDFMRSTRLETDASDFALGAILSQLCADNRWHPIAFLSGKFQPAEVNYDMHDKEMTTIVATFKEWEHLLMSVHDEITVFSDHKNLVYFNSTKVLKRRQHRWAEFLQPFRFKVVYRKGRLNDKADTLLWLRDYHPEGGGEHLEIPQKFFGPGQYEQLPTQRVLISSVRLVLRFDHLSLPVCNRQRYSLVSAVQLPKVQHF